MMSSTDESISQTADISRLSAQKDIGIGLWTMQSSEAGTVNLRREYRTFVEDAQLIESLGFASMWTAEHRFWYDSWCPALIHLQALAAGETTSLRFGNSMLLLPQHDARALAHASAQLDQLTGGRVDLGVSLGYRDTEFDGLGLRRDRRGRIMDAALAELDEQWRTAPFVPCQPGGPPIWVGGMAPSAIARAARRGLGLLLPPTLSAKRVRDVVRDYWALAPEGTVARIGMLKDVFVGDGADSAAFLRGLRRHYLEEIGSWWPVNGGVGFDQTEELRKQVAFNERGALIGAPAEVAGQIDEMFAAGVTHLALRVRFDFVPKQQTYEQLRLLADDVMPLVRDRGAGA